jgi:hypothetical protein
MFTVPVVELNKAYVPEPACVPPNRFPVIVKIPVDPCTIVEFKLFPPTELLVMFPTIAAETVPAVVTQPAAWLVLFREMFAVTTTPLVSANVPPAAAVPPPTNVPAFDVFVIRFTLTSMSMVTVKVLE